jgi:hypothetical protein
MSQNDIKSKSNKDIPFNEFVKAISAYGMMKGPEMDDFLKSIGYRKNDKFVPSN